uniref:Protein phosphatase 2 (Formerly 2A), regulatory subunit B n=1 Tax=Tetraselmis sp. GSL018 TaxID=582737 RepID=A0A061RTI5_9CHLO|mmetsp:Transcript_21684/g.51828  ORF Transcript_21684/g.51828 Transcript_21684/m.51828 type:complete len:560 (-) Transcript_21684:406-2085(-)
MEGEKGPLRVNIGDRRELDGLREAREHALQADTPHVAARGGLFSADMDTGPARFPCSKLKLDQLFLQWLAMPESNALVLQLLEDAKAGKQLHGPSNSSQSPLSPVTHNALFTPPLSPQKNRSPASPHSPTKSFSRGTGSMKASREQEAIPQFYFPNGEELSSEEVSAAYKSIAEAYDKVDEDGLDAVSFAAMVKQVCELPLYVGHSLHNKLGHGRERLPRQPFISWLEANNILRADPSTRLFHALRAEGSWHIVQSDFKHLLSKVLSTHPGLEFLQETPEFQDRYAETVTYRIFYSVNRSGLGKITLRELKRSDLLEALTMLDEEEDINKILKYFSYEHFYVIYCKFWELDTDHDFMIDRDDLLKYGNHALTYRIVDRIFDQAPRQFTCETEGKMGYEDFVWFILSEEDKTTDVSLEYWFSCVDLDCDGAIRPNEMLYFYEEQLHRMECLSQEPVLFEDILCQMTDMISPAKEGMFTLRDLKKMHKTSGTLFNILFNLNKFIAFETRDPFLARQEREDPTLTEWDRFARTEYVRLAMEEEGEESGGGAVWEESFSEASL